MTSRVRPRSSASRRSWCSGTKRNSPRPPWSPSCRSSTRSSRLQRLRGSHARDRGPVRRSPPGHGARLSLCPECFPGEVEDIEPLPRNLCSAWLTTTISGSAGRPIRSGASGTATPSPIGTLSGASFVSCAASNPARFAGGCHRGALGYWWYTGVNLWDDDGQILVPRNRLLLGRARDHIFLARGTPTFATNGRPTRRTCSNGCWYRHTSAACSSI